MSDHFATLRAPHPVLLFVVMFLVTFAVQWVTWQRTYMFDTPQWTEAVQILSTGHLLPADHHVYGYPGTTVLGVATGLTKIGVEALLSIHLSIALIYSLFASGIVLLTYLLRPNIPWWPLVAWALILQHNVYFSTAPSAVLGPILMFFALLILFSLERKNYSLPLLALTGSAAGLAAATRLDIGSIVTATGVMVFAYMARSFRVLLLTSLIALAAFFIANPYMWAGAVEHLTATFEKISAHAGADGYNNVALKDMFIGSVLGSFAFFYLFLALFLKLPTTLPKGFVLWLTVASSVVIVTLFASIHHPPWIFYPMLVPLELFFPLLVMAIIPKTAEKLKISPATIGTFLLGAFVTYYAVRYQLYSH
jgi:hypothetical protein